MNLFKLIISLASQYRHWFIPIVILCVIIFLKYRITVKDHQITRLNDINEQQNKSIVLLNSHIINRDKVIDELRQNNITNQQALITLNQEQRNLLNAIDEQEIIIERLKNKNETLKKWADTPLPDDLIRLFRRTRTIINSQDYKKYVSDGRSLFIKTQSFNQ